jgi:hypothetical protein
MPVLDRSLFDVPGDALPRPHDNCYWLIPGQLLAGEHPGSQFREDCIERIDALLDAGVRQVVDLTDFFEGPGPYVTVLRERAEARSVLVTHHRFAITDFGVPSAELMRTVLDTVYAGLAAGDAVYVHCWGGVGRTGTVVGCLLREQGLGAAEALALIDRKWQAMEKRMRHPHSPETPEQIAFIERWAVWNVTTQPIDRRT